MLSFAFCDVHYGIGESILSRLPETALSRALPTVTALAPRLRGAVGTGTLSAVRLPLPGGQTPPPQRGLTLAWSFAMSGLRSERLKSWKEEKEAIVRGAHAALGLLGILPTPANTGSHPTPTRTTRSSATGSQDEEGTGRSTDPRPVPSVSGRPEPQMRGDQTSLGSRAPPHRAISPH